MNIHNATEQAYKNGYKAGVKELMARVNDQSSRYGLMYGGIIRDIIGRVAVEIDCDAKELIDKQRKEDGNGNLV